MSITQVTTKGQVDVCGVDFHQTQCGYLRAMLVEGDMMISQTAALPLEAMLMPMVQAASECLVCVGGPTESISPETMSKPLTRAPADCEEQGSYYCSNINDCRCIVEKE